MDLTIWSLSPKPVFCVLPAVGGKNKIRWGKTASRELLGVPGVSDRNDTLLSLSYHTVG